MPKKVTRTLFKARHVIVNCKDNDPVDVRCGGPLMLGFDFYVDSDEKPAAIRDFIKAVCERYRVPVVGSIIVGPPDEEVRKLWTRRMISGLIKRDGPHL